MTFENQGYLSIGDQDEVNFQNQTGSSFINTGEMNVEGDFHNHGISYRLYDRNWWRFHQPWKCFRTFKTAVVDLM